MVRKDKQARIPMETFDLLQKKYPDEKTNIGRMRKLNELLEVLIYGKKR